MVETPFALNERPQPNPTGWTCIQKASNESPLLSLSLSLYFSKAMHTHNNIIHLSVLAFFSVLDVSVSLSYLFTLIFSHFCLFLFVIQGKKTAWHRIKVLYCTFTHGVLLCYVCCKLPTQLPFLSINFQFCI